MDNVGITSSVSHVNFIDDHKDHIGGLATKPPETQDTNTNTNTNANTNNVSYGRNIFLTQDHNSGIISSDSDDAEKDTSITTTGVLDQNMDYSESSPETFSNFSDKNTQTGTLFVGAKGSGKKYFTRAQSNTVLSIQDEIKQKYGEGTESDYKLGDETDYESIEDSEGAIDISLSGQNTVIQDPYEDNNLVYQVRGDGLGKSYVGNASRYPPRLDSNHTVGALHEEKELFTYRSCDNNTSEPLRNVNYSQIVFEEVPRDDYCTDSIISGTHAIIEDDRCIVTAIRDYELSHEEIEQVYDEKDDVIRIKNKNDQWIINVPITYEDGTTTKTAVFADAGANHGCVQTKWAFKHFPSYIRLNSRTNKVFTPSGFVIPKYVLWLTFPTNKGFILKARMYLMNELPVKILAGINMLRAFGYSFKDGTPPIFQHAEKEDVDFELKDQEDQFKVFRHSINWFQEYRFRKIHRYKYCTNINRTKDFVNPSERINFYQELEAGEKVLYTHTGGSTIQETNEEYKERIECTDKNNNNNDSTQVNVFLDEDYIADDQTDYDNDHPILSPYDGPMPVLNCYKDINNDSRFDDELVQDVDVALAEKKFVNQLYDLDEVDVQIDLHPLGNHIQGINTIIDDMNGVKGSTYYLYNNYNYTRKLQDFQVPLIHNVADASVTTGLMPFYHKALFIRTNKSFEATEAEKAKAKELMVNEPLKWNKFEYLKDYPIKYGPQFIGLYEAVMKWMHNNKDIFATHTYSRRTMNVPPARLGIKPEHRDKIMFARQYPISAEKRLHMINYTIINEKNGFWHPIKFSLNCIPYTMVPKKKGGIVVRWRPAFDGRIVNQYCQLMVANMPTLQDFKELHSRRGLTTVADLKNFFDCIPLHKLDRKYAVASTPLGLFMMTCLTYGWMNAAPIAQKITNQMALHIGDCLAYIDDICIKHTLEHGTQGVMRQLDRMAFIVRKFNGLLTPAKLFIAIEQAITLSFKFGILTRAVSDAYTRKLVTFVLPLTKKELDTFLGCLLYVNEYVYKHSLFTYWMRQLKEKLCIVRGKKVRRLQWTREAKLAWYGLQYLIHNLPLLYHPTSEGLFCLQTDACNYGLGAVLWQLQLQKDNQERWVIVDMWSKTMPGQLRHCHSMIHEAYAIVAACEHWQFYLIKRKFIVSTDNAPVAAIFGILWKELSPITQRQLLRLRNKVNMFTFDSYHVKGLDNPIADGLSRFFIQLTKTNKKYQPTLNAIHSDDTNTRALTPQEFKELEQETLRITRKFRQLKASKAIPLVNAIQFTSVMGSNYGFGTQDSVYEQHKAHRTAAWNDLMREYKHHTLYLHRPTLNHYLQSAESQLVYNNEQSFNTPTLSNVYSSIANICYIQTQFSTPTKTYIADTILGQEGQSTRAHVLLSQTKGLALTTKDSVYNPLDDYIDLEGADAPAPITQGVSTRSQTRKQKGKQTAEDIANQYNNAEFNDIRARSQTRDQFLQDIFGHRKNLDIFKMDKFIEYQKGHNILNVLRKLYHTEASQRSKQDMDLLYRWEPYLWSKLQFDQIKIDKNDAILVNTYDRIRDTNSWKLYVPFNIRGKLMDYKHHNLTVHHFDKDQTIDNIEYTYYWGTLRRDVRKFVETCPTCQYAKGSKRHRTPLVQRELPKPREHLLADFLGAIFGIYYILVLVDYATGYVVLVPTHGTDGITVVHSIVHYWIKTFGWFKTFETDWGSGFSSKLMKALTKLTGVQLELAEPRNHRSIGKVERTIGFIQSIIQHYNLLLSERLTQQDNYESSWHAIESILPFIQLAINQHRPRFTTISPNMLMFGSNVQDISDIDGLHQLLKDIQIQKGEKKKEVLQKDDYEYLQQLIDQLHDIRQLFKQDWKKYVWISAQQHNQKYKITPKSIQRNKKIFQKGKKVLYYIGDKQVPQRKWRRKWTGPWTIDKIINDTTIIIGDPESGNQKRVSLDRIKLFKERDNKEYIKLFNNDQEYVEHQDYLMDQLRSYNVEFREKDFELDYTKNKR